MAVRIISLMTKLAMDGTQFQQGLSRAKQQFGQFASNFKSQLAGIFGAAVLIQQVRQVTEFAGRISDLSKKLGVSKIALQEFEHAAKLEGATLEDVAAAFRGLAKAREDALLGDKEKTAAFAAFGVDRAMLQAGNLEVIFKRIASTVRTVDFGADELPMVEHVLGKMGSALIPAMKSGLEDAADEAHRLGIILGEDVVRALDKAGDEIERLAARTRKPLAEMTANLANFATEIVTQADQAFGGFGAWLGGLIHTPGSIKERLAGARESEQSHLAEIAARGMPVEDPARTPRSSVAMREAMRVLQLRQKLETMQFQGLDAEEKTNRLLTRKSELERQIGDVRKRVGPLQAFDEAGLLESEIELEGINADLKGREKKPEGGASGRLRDFQLSASEQIGAFSGITAQRGFALTQFEQQKSELKNLVKEAQKSSTHLASIDNKIGKTNTTSFF